MEKTKGGIRMKVLKVIKYSVISFVLVGLIGIGSLLGIGYKGYEDAINVMSIEEKVEAMRASNEFVAIQDIDEDFIHAIVAVEDHRFYEHGAVDFIGLIRAFMTNLKEGSFVQGGSTITQQLAKNMYFGSEQTLERKVAELFVAANLEDSYTKDEILELYMNEVYFGKGCYGIGEASAYFFGKNPGDLSKDEAAFLAGLPQSPSRYASNMELAKKRQQVVLNAMEENKISK